MNVDNFFWSGFFDNAKILQYAVLSDGNISFTYKTTSHFDGLVVIILFTGCNLAT